MTQEKIETLDRLRDELADIERWQVWMNEWGKTIKETKDGVFHVTIENGKGVCCLQKKISKEDAVREFNLYAKELADKRADIKRQIDEL